MILSVIIPIYNEQNTVISLIDEVLKVQLPAGIKKEIILVDDGSTDRTRTLLQEYNSHPLIKIILKATNEGKTAAVKAGLADAQGEVVLIQDADLEYSPDHYPSLLEPILKKQASVVYGSRFKGKIQNMTLINKLANLISNWTINFLYRSQLTDFHTCFKVFERESLGDIKLTSQKFSFDTELTLKFLDRGYHIYEVPINYRARGEKDGKKMTWAMALETYWLLLKYKFMKGDSGQRKNTPIL